MEQSEILLRILLSVVFGAIIGLETETREIQNKGSLKAKKEEKNRIGGVRTFTVLSLIGGIAGLFYFKNEAPIVYITFSAVIALVVAAYVMNVQINKAFGVTTEIAILITFLLGFLTTSNVIDIPVILVILILLTFFMSQKRGIGALIEKIRHEELIDVIKFGLVSAVMLPLLPNETYHLHDLIKFFDLENLNITNKDLTEIAILNPFKIWLIVVIISGINLGAYLASKVIGQKKSLLITAIIGGFVSSTSTTIAFATQSKKGAKNKLLASGALITNAASFITVLIILATLNRNLLNKLYLPLISMMVIGFLAGLAIAIHQKDGKPTGVSLKESHFSILPAIKFVSLIVGITLLIQIVSLSKDENVIAGVTALSGFTGFDAAAIATANLEQSGEITLGLAAAILLLTNAVNFLAKIIYAFLYGNREFAYTLTIGLIITLIGSLSIFII